MTFALYFCLIFLCRYSQFLQSKSSEEVIPFAVATGNVGQLVGHFHGNGQYLDAMVGAQAACEDAFYHPHLLKKEKSQAGGVTEEELNEHKQSVWVFI
jgi:hypothetical protein